MFSFSGGSRSLQVCVGIISLVLSSVLVRLNLSIGTAVGDLNGFISSEPAYNVTTPQSANIVSMVSSGLTLGNKGLLAGGSQIDKIRSANKVAFYKRNRPSGIASRVINTSMPFQTLSHLAGIMGSEAVENLTWFGSTILGLVKTGDWNCNDANSLVTNYNLTSNVLDNFQQFMGESEVLKRDNSLVTRSQLLLQLSDNCKLNKASSAMSILNYLLYMLTSGLVINSFVTFMKEFNALDGLVELEYVFPFHCPKVKKKVITIKEIEEELLEDKETEEMLEDNESSGT